MLIQQPADAVQARLNELLDRQTADASTLAGFRLERASLAARIEKLSGAERAEAMATLEMMESHTAITSARLAETRRNIAELRTPAAGTLQAPSVTRMFGLTEAEFIGGGTFLLLLPMAIAMARNIWTRGGRARATLSDDRLERIERAVEAVAIEVERIGESQRFTSRVLAEQQPGEQAAVRQEPAPRPVITPRP